MWSPWKIVYTRWKNENRCRKIECTVWKIVYPFWKSKCTVWKKVCTPRKIVFRQWKTWCTVWKIFITLWKIIFTPRKKVCKPWKILKISIHTVKLNYLSVKVINIKNIFKYFFKEGFLRMFYPSRRKIIFPQNLHIKVIIRNFVKFKFTDFKNQFRKVIF